MDIGQRAGRTYFPLTACKVDFDRTRELVTLLPTCYVLGCKYANRGFMLSREGVHALITALEKALSTLN